MLLDGIRNCPWKEDEGCIKPRSSLVKDGKLERGNWDWLVERRKFTGCTSILAVALSGCYWGFWDQR